jgi:dolichyl-phosphate beta-glucosyltransferase
MLKARGDFIMFADADGATPIDELDKFLPFIKADCEVMIASRFSGDSDNADVSRKGFRAFLGMFFYKLVNLLAVPGIKDTQCGFKIFRKDIAEKILAHAEETGWAFDVEFLYIAQLFGCEIKEISVNWSEIEGSKVNPVKDSIKMLTAIFRIRSTHGGFLNDT